MLPLYRLTTTLEFVACLPMRLDVRLCQRELWRQLRFSCSHPPSIDIVTHRTLLYFTSKRSDHRCKALRRAIARHRHKLGFLDDPWQNKS